VANVFHEVPQPMNGGSGLPGPVTHCQVLEGLGRQAQSGQRMRPKSSSSSGRRSVSVRFANTGPSAGKERLSGISTGYPPSLSARRSTFPIKVFGRSARNSTRDGTLRRQSLVAECAQIGFRHRLPGA
jgi:hypothetical protein